MLLKLSAKLIVKKSAGFAAAFVVSFVSFLAAILVQDSTGHKQESWWAVLPAVAFFISCWLLNARFVKYGAENDSIKLTEAFSVTLLQCAALFIFIMILSFMFIGGLMLFANQAK